MNRRSRFWVGGAAALGAGALLVGPLRATAQDDDTDDDTAERTPGWVSEALDDLVADGTITQQQADAVDQALADARPERIHRHGRGGPFRGFLGLEAAADAIGIDETDLRDALRNGQTIAEVAEANGVEVQAVIDAMTAAAEARLDEAMANADERLADLEEKITELVDEGFPIFPHRKERPATEDDATSTTEPTTEPTTPPPTTAD
jgi:hypothetical protein